MPKNIQIPKSKLKICSNASCVLGETCSRGYVRAVTPEPNYLFKPHSSLCEQTKAIGPSAHKGGVLREVWTTVGNADLRPEPLCEHSHVTVHPLRHAPASNIAAESFIHALTTSRESCHQTTSSCPPTFPLLTSTNQHADVSPPEKWFALDNGMSQDQATLGTWYHLVSVFFCGSPVAHRPRKVGCVCAECNAVGLRRW